jgi:hypothetical protein
MNEHHFREVEVVLLYLTDARRRASKAARTLSRAGGSPRAVEAAREAEQELDRISLRLMQRTYFAVPREQLTLS